MEMNIERRSKPERLRQTADHLGAMVTAMVWDSTSSGLFVGDNAGKVTHINVPTSKVFLQLCRLIFFQFQCISFRAVLGNALRQLVS